MGTARKRADNVIEMPKPVENRAATVDRYGELKAKVLAFGPTQKEYETLGKRIQGWYENEAADKSFTESGSSFTVEISARSVERSANKPKLFARLGKKRFLDLCGFTLKHLSLVVPGEEQSGFVTEARTGSRRLDAVPIGVKDAA